nr:MAG TPA: hypothetical protein [Caudoviricetes sp.]
MVMRALYTKRRNRIWSFPGQMKSLADGSRRAFYLPEG